MEDESKSGKMQAPGTLVLAFIFLGWFVTLYFLNWSLLSKMWHIG